MEPTHGHASEPRPACFQTTAGSESREPLGFPVHMRVRSVAGLETAFLNLKMPSGCKVLSCELSVSHSHRSQTTGTNLLAGKSESLQELPTREAETCSEQVLLGQWPRGPAGCRWPGALGSGARRSGEVWRGVPVAGWREGTRLEDGGLLRGGRGADPSPSLRAESARACLTPGLPGPGPERVRGPRTSSRQPSRVTCLHLLPGRACVCPARRRRVCGSQEGCGGRLHDRDCVCHFQLVSPSASFSREFVFSRSGREALGGPAPCPASGRCPLVAGPRRDQGGPHEADPVRHQGAEPERSCHRGLALALSACVPRSPRD